MWTKEHPIFSSYSEKSTHALHAIETTLLWRRREIRPRSHTLLVLPFSLPLPHRPLPRRWPESHWRSGSRWNSCDKFNLIFEDEQYIVAKSSKSQAPGFNGSVKHIWKIETVFSGIENNRDSLSQIRKKRKSWSHQNGRPKCKTRGR